MTNMVEKVARALCAKACIGPVDVNDPYVDANWPRYVRPARAAIEAMREPSPEMKAAAGRVWGRDIAHDAYAIMIAEALK